MPSYAPTYIPSTAIPTVAPSTPTSTPTLYPSLSPNTLFIITTFAGTGTASYSGDNGQATSATIGYSNGVAVDKYGKQI